MQATTDTGTSDRKISPSGAPRGPLAEALMRVGDRWSLLVVEALAGGPRRFADLQQSIPGIATNVLAQRLRRLESDRIVLAVPYSRRPLRYAYELTAAGHALGGAARLLANWNTDQGFSTDRAPAHPLCGTPMEVRWYCPTCDRVSDDGGGEDVVWV